MAAKLSPVMQEALSLVPTEWQRPPIGGFRFRRQFVAFPLFHRTFYALKRRELVEWRGGPGKWEWRRSATHPIDTAG